MRDAWTRQERQEYNTKKNEYQKQVRESETKEEYISRLNADRDQHYKKMASDREVIKAVNNRKRIDDGTFLVASFENDSEEKIYATWEKRQLNLRIRMREIRATDEAKQNRNAKDREARANETEAKKQKRLRQRRSNYYAQPDHYIRYQKCN